jgi:hypothetical protein
MFSSEEVIGEKVQLVALAVQTLGTMKNQLSLPL